MLEPISTISWNRNCCNRTQGCTGDRRRRQEAGLICVRHQLIYINVYTVNCLYCVYYTLDFFELRNCKLLYGKKLV